MMSPNHELTSKIKDSLAAKAANEALLKWHSNMPLAGLHHLEHMYNRFYKYYYNNLENLSPLIYGDHHFHHDDYEHHHGYHHRLGLTHGHHSRHAHDHQPFDLLDFLKGKSDKPNLSNYKGKKSIIDKILGK